MLGKKPSFKLLSSFLISSIELAFAMASFTLSASSFDIRRPAFPGTATGRGSSVDTTCFEVCVAEVDIEVASAFIRPSAVRKSFLEASRSCHFRREPQNHPLSALQWHGGEFCEPRTLSRIRWKSKTLSAGNLQASHSRYHFFSWTGFPIKLRYLSPLTSRNGSKSPNSVILLFVRTSVVRCGTERWIDGEIEDIRLLARRSVCSRLSSGRFPSATIELSVRSMASCWSC